MATIVGLPKGYMGSMAPDRVQSDPSKYMYLTDKNPGENWEFVTNVTISRGRVGSQESAAWRYKTPEPSAPAHTPSPASPIKERADQLNQGAEEYADEKLEGVDDAIPAPPDPVPGEPTSVAQGVSAKDLMIASEGDTDRAMQKSTRVGLNTELKQKRRKSLLSIPRY